METNRVRSKTNIFQSRWLRNISVHLFILKHVAEGHTGANMTFTLLKMICHQPTTSEVNTRSGVI